MAYFILALLVMTIIFGGFALIGAAGYVFYYKVICGSKKSISELLSEF